MKGGEIRAGFFPGRKTVCPRIYPKCKLNIPLSTTKFRWMGGCAASWRAGKSETPYSFAFSSGQTGTSVSVGVILSFHLGHTYSQFRLTLRKERGDRPDSEPHVYIWKIMLPNKMDHFWNGRSGLLMNAESSNPSWGRMKWSDAFLEVYWAETNISVSQGKWRAKRLGNWSSQDSSEQPQALSGSSGQQGAEGLFRSIENVDDYP